jgi:hypothetical protein
MRVAGPRIAAKSHSFHRRLWLDQRLDLLGGERRPDDLVGDGVRQDRVEPGNLVGQDVLLRDEVVAGAARDALRDAGPSGIDGVIGRQLVDS